MNDRGWLLLVCRLPAEPARHRMALWRLLRRAGAIPVAQGVWALPSLPAVQPVVDSARSHATEADGELLVLTVSGEDAEALDRDYLAAREQEWIEFRADCEKYLAELEKEHRIEKYTLAELEEEEQSLDRLRRWYRDLRARDLFGTPGLTASQTLLRDCLRSFDDYADHVYAALGAHSADKVTRPVRHGES